MSNANIPNTFYRVSTKALIFDETQEQFMVILEDNGWWELPGGGLDWGEPPKAALTRELSEETGLTLTTMSAEPRYCLVGKNTADHWSVNLVYEVTVADITAYTPTSEALEMKFITPEEAKKLNAWRNVTELAELLQNKQ